MKLVPIKVEGIYGRPGSLLPATMALLTPDAASSLEAVKNEIENRGGCFRLSDAYRSTAMQARAHDDFVKGRKKAYSPPAGGSMHEAGRAIDIDLAALIHPPSVPKGSQTFNEQQVRAIFESRGWTFIAPAGDPHRVDIKESWHIEFRGPFQAVYDAVMRRTGSRTKAYQAMSAAAIEDLKNEDATKARTSEPAREEVESKPAAQPQPVPSVNENSSSRSLAMPTVAARLKSSTTFLQSLGIQVGAMGAAVWSFLASNRDILLYVLAGAAVVSLGAYLIYTWKEVQVKRMETEKR